MESAVIETAKIRLLHDKPLTLERILLHVTHHNAIHTGQIVWMAKMLGASTVRDLWRRTLAL